MSLFCLLWVPLFYLFRHSITAATGAGSIWALILGSITAVFQFFLGNLVDPGGFGYSRWFYAFVDIVALPVLIPLLVCLLFTVLRLFSGGTDFCNFALLWLIPAGALRAVGWSSQSDPILLVIVPLLWTAVASGVSFFIHYFVQHFRWQVILPASFGILALPVTAATAYWAFFSQKYILAIIFLFAALIPMLISVILDFIQNTG